MNRRLGLLILILLALGGGAWVAVTSGDDAGRDAAPQRPDTARSVPPPPPPSPPRPRARAGEAEPPAPDPVRTAGPEVSSAEPPATPPASVPPPRTTSSQFERLAVTFLRFIEPRKPPAGVREIKEGEKPVIPEGGSQLGGGGPSLVGWSRWHPIPPKGGVTYRGRVVDADGKPVAGAEVLRVELDENGTRASPASFQWVAEAAKTGADGTFEARNQPDGAYLLQGNWRRRMNRPRGLDLAGALPVRASGADVVRDVEIRLPFVAARLGGLRVTVRNEEGAPVARAQVMCGFEGGWTGADGRIHLGGLEPGDQAVTCRATGFAAASATFAVVAGAAPDVEIVLQLATSGTLEIAGQVVDEDGRAVPGLPMFLSDGTRDGVRWATCDAEGRFRFPKLPDAWASRTVDVMVSPMPERDPYVAKGKQALRVPETSAEFVVRKLTPVRVVVRDAADGSPITLFNLDVKIEVAGEAPRQLSSRSCYEETGTTTLHAPKGRLIVQVEGKGHRPMEIAADVTDVDTPKEIVVEMPAE